MSIVAPKWDSQNWTSNVMLVMYIYVQNGFDMFKLETEPDLAPDELKTLWLRVYPGDGDRTFENELAAPNVINIVARSDGPLVGFARLVLDGGIHGFLLDPIVHPDFRGNGIGHALIKGLLARARELNVRFVHVDYLPELEPFYQSAGFLPTSAGLIELAKG
jgi:GNAT superfamily N-acetyltransferase